MMTTATIGIVGYRLPGLSWNEHSNVHVGVQRRRHVINVVAGDAARAVFDVPVEVVLDPTIGIDYRGPFAQGKRGQRFIYLNWGELAAENRFIMFRRAKLNLFTIPEHIARALADGCTVHAELELTDARGEPICASIPPQIIHWMIDDVSS
jgi:hypothetical protein